MEALGIGPGRSVLDLAAGTGKLTRLLVPTGAHITAVEPLAGMRAELERAMPGGAGAGPVTVLDGTAEAIPLPAASMDAVTVAQAFHWFDGRRARAEIHRVLRPGGALGLIWNVRDRSVEWVDRLATLTEPYAGDVPRHRNAAWREAFDEADDRGGTALFTPLEQRTYPHPHDVDRATMVERVASISWIGSLPDAERLPLLERCRALFESYPDPLPGGYVTEVYWCRARTTPITPT